MPVDDRIRAGLSRNAQVALPPVEEHLATVARRHRRRTVGRFAAGAAAVVLLALVPLWAFTTLGDRDPRPARPSASALAGTYRVVVDGVGEASDLGGTWLVTLTTDGRVDLTPPRTYRGAVSDGASYEVSGAMITTDLFVDSTGCQRMDPAVGTYRVTVNANEAKFTRVNDSCPARAALFGVTWRRLP
jgi:hypothetical protein